jgi:tryptophan-rich sensory protein
MRILIFFLLNFAALALGGFLSGNPGENEWYQGLNKAPFTPPGWVFGFAWTTIMIFFSFFMSHITGRKKISEVKTILIIYSIQWIFNVAWNPFFFKFHEVRIAQIILVVLTFTILYFLIFAIQKRNWLNIFLILPYFLWLMVANALNAYVLLYN